MFNNRNVKIMSDYKKGQEDLIDHIKKEIQRIDELNGVNFYLDLMIMLKRLKAKNKTD